MQGWIMDELRTADLRDKRLERRFVKLLDSLSHWSNKGDTHKSNHTIQHCIPEKQRVVA